MTRNTTASAPTRFIGCDVSKHSIVAHDSRDTSTRTLDNRPQALAAFARSLDADCLVVCEATGGHELALLDACLDAGVPVHRADARRVKAFIRSFGTLAKTDPVDARALARYGAERHHLLARWHAPDKHRARLQALVLTRRDLVDDRTAHINRLKAPAADAAARYLKAVIACLERQIQKLDAAIKALLTHCETLARTDKVLRTIPGLGETTAAGLIALMPELGTLSRRQAAALAGLAPHPKDTGMTNGYRRTKGGRPEVRKTLFMAALAASRHHPQLKAFNRRLLAKGKKPIVAQTAVMRKLIVIANAKIRDEFQCQKLS